MHICQKNIRPVNLRCFLALTGGTRLFLSLSHSHHLFFVLLDALFPPGPTLVTGREALCKKAGDRQEEEKSDPPALNLHHLEGMFAFFSATTTNNVIC